MIDQNKRTVADYNREPPAAKYELDSLKAKDVWGNYFESLSDLFSTTTTAGDGTSVKYPTHTLGLPPEALRLIAFDNGNGVFQQDLCRFIYPGEMVLAIKHCSPLPSPHPIAVMKFQCDHTQVIIGVRKRGCRGVITLTNPQNYYRRKNRRRQRRGLFAQVDESLLMLKIRLPGKLPPALKMDYIANIRTWLTIANTFTTFPSGNSFNGFDSLTVTDLAEVKTFGDRLILAIEGDREARAWLKHPGNRIYCGELIHLGLNLGIHFPLNAHALGEERHRRLLQHMHRRSLLMRNPNRHSRLVSLQMAPETLRPLPELLREQAVSDGKAAPIFNDLAVQPATLAEGLDLLITHTVPRESGGEQLASCQAELLRRVERQIYRLLGVRPNHRDPGDQPDLVRIYRQIITVTENRYPHYRAFRAALTPLLTQFDHAATEQRNAVRYFMPPHLYMLRAAEALRQNRPGEMIGWQYLGHGIHRQLLRVRETAMVSIPSGVS